MSIALPWSEFKAYVAEVGPGRGGVARPAQCVFCDGERVWFNGWRQILVTLLVDGQPHRLADWLPLQRVRCAQPPCRRSWTLRPPWLYPHRSLEPDLAETAALTLPRRCAGDVSVGRPARRLLVGDRVALGRLAGEPGDTGRGAGARRPARAARGGAGPAAADGRRGRPGPLAPPRRRRAARLSGGGRPEHAPPGPARAAAGPESPPLVPRRRVPRVPASGPAHPAGLLPGV